MNSLFKTLLIATSLLVGNMVVAQETKDYYKFDDQGNLTEFQLTLSDNTVVKLKYYWNEDREHSLHDDLKDGEYALITYPNGMVIDFSPSVINTNVIGRQRYPLIWTTEKNPETGWTYFEIKEWYKIVKKTGKLPKGSDILTEGPVLNLREIVVNFSDDSQIRIKDGEIREYTDVDSGNYFTYDGRIRNLNLKRSDCPILDVETSDIHQEDCAVSGVYETYSEKSQAGFGYFILKGSIIYKDGKTYKGTFHTILQRQDSLSVRSPYLKTIISNSLTKYGIGCAFENIYAFSFIDGVTTDKNGKILEMYKNEQKLDEIDIASILAAEQGKIDREKAAAKKAASEKAAITKKYGKKYADAFFAGKVITGMPWDLVEMGLKANQFKNFYGVMLSIDRQSSSGYRRCYTLIGGEVSYVGHMWVANGAVESVTYY